MLATVRVKTADAYQALKFLKSASRSARKVDLGFDGASLTFTSGRSSAKCPGTGQWPGVARVDRTTLTNAMLFLQDKESEAELVVEPWELSIGSLRLPSDWSPLRGPAARI
jgi:hypothetical protein